MEIRSIPVDQINPAPYNPRKDLQPGDPEYEKIKKSIEEFGLVEPLVWNQRSGNLVGGHQRFKVELARGSTRVECSVVDLDDTRERLLNLALNRVQGEWDQDRLAELLRQLSADGVDLELTGFDPAELDRLTAVDPPDVEFPEYDETVEKTVKRATCPNCGHEFPV